MAIACVVKTHICVQATSPCVQISDLCQDTIMPTPGLLFVRSRITSPDLTDSAFKKWYSEVHFSDVLESGLADLALRYENANPEAKYPYLVVYRLPDLGFVQDEKKMQTIPMKSELLPGSGEVSECTDMDIRAYEIIQRFEGQVEKEGTFDTHTRLQPM